MKHMFWNLSPVLAGVALLAVTVLPGCETADEDDYAGVRVSPTYASLRKNQSVTLTATGGWDYRWSLAEGDDPYAYGSLSSTHGESVTYTVRKVPAGMDDYLQVVRVTGKVSNYAASLGGTNGLGTAESRINHRAPSAPSTP